MKFDDLKDLSVKYAANQGICHTKRTMPAWHYSAMDFRAGWIAHEKYSMNHQERKASYKAIAALKTIAETPVVCSAEFLQTFAQTVFSEIEELQNQ